MNLQAKEIGMVFLDILTIMKCVKEMQRIGSEEHVELIVQHQQTLYRYGITTHGDKFFAIDPATQATKQIVLEG